MTPSTTNLAASLALDEFPRSHSYDPVWALENLMGPNALWLAEAISQVMEFRPGMRVLDLGCGKAVSSVFLAKEFGLQVWAVDPMVGPSDNWRTVSAAGLGDRVCPLRAEAHALPFADEFFDALVSLDAYHYFGTDDLFLSYYARFVKPGGQIGIVVPGLRDEFTRGLPPHLAPYWLPGYWSFHGPGWWRGHWERSGEVVVEHADLLPDGWRHWLTWHEVCFAHGYPANEREAQMLREDAGRTLGFTRVVGRKKTPAEPGAAPDRGRR